MESDFPSLEGINQGAAYKGPFVLLSSLDSSMDYSRFKFPCGHRAGVQHTYRCPGFLKKYLTANNLLATVGVFTDAIFFDPHRIKRVAFGHREKEFCPMCFFEKALLAVGPTCPNCHQMLKPKKLLILYSYEEIRPKIRKFRVIRITEGKNRWYAACCAPKRATPVKSKLFWDGANIVSL